MEPIERPERPKLRPELAERLYQSFESEMIRLTATCEGVGMGSDELIAYVREGNRRAGLALAYDAGKPEEAKQYEDRLNNALTAAMAGKARAVEMKQELEQNGGAMDPTRPIATSSARASGDGEQWRRP